MASNPCVNCNIHGLTYSEENCKDCEYNQIVKLLKQVLLTWDSCYTHCQHGQGYDEYQCGICNQEKCGECVNHNKYVIEINKVLKDYNIK